MADDVIEITQARSYLHDRLLQRVASFEPPQALRSTQRCPHEQHFPQRWKHLSFKIKWKLIDGTKSISDEFNCQRKMRFIFGSLQLSFPLNYSICLRSASQVDLAIKLQQQNQERHAPGNRTMRF